MISGDQLRDARGRAGLTQEELGLRVGVSLRPGASAPDGAGSATRSWYSPMTTATRSEAVLPVDERTEAIRQVSAVFELG